LRILIIVLRLRLGLEVDRVWTVVCGGWCCVDGAARGVAARLDVT
jgi:hypothetical protein